MGRLTEVFDIVKHGFSDPENYHWIESMHPETRDVLKELRKDKQVQPTLFDRTDAGDGHGCP
ncbi:hypothetical protein LCGC14_2921210 [marine sediment metagenome]|uniref:Uncharacterized protein n=1 Tax=marine sediment metagenome TaxID=412755 RepID=A0A0F8ZWB0_9ZZZZ